MEGFMNLGERATRTREKEGRRVKEEGKRLKGALR